MAQLPVEDSRRIFERDIEPVLFSTVSVGAHGTPRAVLIGGQPGSGKSSRLRGPVARELDADGGAVIIDVDAMRPYHPLYDFYNEQDDTKAAENTHADASAWAEMGIEAAIRQRCHVVFDGTLGSPEGALRRLRRFVAAGYDVEVRVLAIDADTSWLNVLTRYENGKATGVGRMTPREVHDEAFDGLVQTLDAVQEDFPNVRISLYDRNRTMIFDSSTNGIAASRALDLERQRPLTPAEKKERELAIDGLIQLARQRQAPQSVIHEYESLGE